jgi:hypothetical protein
MARKMGSLELVQFPWASKACGAKVMATAKASGTLDMISPAARISAARVRAG